MSLVLANNPGFPTTEPLALPVDSLDDAARLVFSDPIYLDNGRDLWIQRADAPPVEKLLGKPLLTGQVHLTRDRVVFAYQTLDAEGKAQSQIVRATPDGQFELLNHDGRIALGTAGRNYRWDRAAWIPRERDSAIVVPTDFGIAIFRPQQRPIELFQDLRGNSQILPATAPATNPAPTQSTSANPEPTFLLDWRGLLAWIPYDHDRFAGAGAFRFVDGKWIHLDEDSGWPKRLVHLIPGDLGTVVQMVADDQDDVHLQTALLDADLVNDATKQATTDSTTPSTTPTTTPKTQTDEVADLVKMLSDRESKTRDDALDQLARKGPGIWSELEKLRAAQPPEGQIRIDQLLKDKSKATLGRMTLEPGPVTFVMRSTEGVSLFYADAGYSKSEAAGANLIAPAWIVINPKTIQPASPFLIADLDPDTARVNFINGDWIVTNDAIGPQRFLGNSFERLLRKSERDYSALVGTDSRGRWLFHHVPDDGKTLIVDPTLPDPTPKLPVWQYDVPNGSVGWTAENWPVIKSPGEWVIDATGPRPLVDGHEKMITELATAAPSAATTQVTETPIGIDADGGEYFDGQEKLRYRSLGKQSSTDDIVWNLPAEAQSGSQAKIFSAAGHLFLFNEPGRVIRLTRTGERDNPFRYDATFTKNIPNVSDPKRIWLDPAGRIVIAYEGKRLAILFPAGQIPPSIESIMTADALKANREE